MGALIAWHCTKKDFNSLPTIPAFKDTEEKRLWKTLWEKEKISKKEIFILATFNLSSANAFSFCYVKEFVVW